MQLKISNLSFIQYFHFQKITEQKQNQNQKEQEFYQDNEGNQYRKIVNHYFDSSTHLPLIQELEPPIRNTAPRHYLMAVQMHEKWPFMSWRAGLSTNQAQIQDEYQGFNYIQSTEVVKQLYQFVKQLIDQLPQCDQQQKEGAVQEKHRIALFAKNSPLWMLTDIANQFADCISVPLYDTLSWNEIIYCLNLTKTEIIFVSNEKVPGMLAIMNQVPSLKFIVSFDKVDKQDTVGKATKMWAQMEGNGFVINDDKTSTSQDTSSKQQDTPQQPAQQPTQQQDQQQQQQDNQQSPLYVKEINEVLENKSENIKLIEIPEISFNDESNEFEFLSEIYKNLHQSPDDINSIIFTSGTSGHPKGAYVTHANLISGGACLGRQFVPYKFADNKNVDFNKERQSIEKTKKRYIQEGFAAVGKYQRDEIPASIPKIQPLEPSDPEKTDLVQNRYLSYLPLAHVFERDMEYLAIFRGMHIFYHAGSIKLLTQDMKLSSPTVLLGVPRVYQKIYDSFMKQLNQKSFLIRSVFWSAYYTKKALMQMNPRYIRTGQVPVVDKVFAPLHDAFGGSIEFFVSGSSVLPEKIREFMEVCSGARLTVGYGLTEACCTGLYNACTTKFYTQGQLGKGCYLTDCRLKLNEGSKDTGELQIKSPGVIGAYVDQEKQFPYKKEVNEWFSTKDICSISEDGSVQFMYRASNKIKLQQGEFVDIEQIENIIENISYVEGSAVYGRGDIDKVICITNVDIKVLLAENKLESLKKLLQNPEDEKEKQQLIEQLKQHGNKEVEAELEQMLIKDGDKAIRSRGMAGFNCPAHYVIVFDQDWMNDKDLFTPSMKKRRQEFYKKYDKEIQQMVEKMITKKNN